MQYLYVTSEYDPTVKEDVVRFGADEHAERVFVPANFLYERFGDPEEADGDSKRWFVSILMATPSDVYGKAFHWVSTQIKLMASGDIRVTGNYLPKTLLEKMHKALQ